MTLSVAGGTLSVAGGTLVGLSVAHSGSFVAQQNSGSFNTSYTIPALTGVLSTDVLVAFASCVNGTQTVTAPAGFTQIGDSAGQARCFVYTAPGSANASTTWTWSLNQWHRIVIVAYRGVQTPTSAKVSTATSNSSTVTSLALPSLTAAAASATLVSYMAASGGTLTGPTGMTSEATATGSAAFALDDQALTASGATGTRTFTLAAAAIMVGAQLVLEHT